MLQRYVDGHMTAKHLTAVLGIEVGQEIKSIGYTAGVSGWRLDGEGNLEANDGLFRGTVASTSFTADDAMFDGNVHAQGLNLEFGATIGGAATFDDPPGATPPSIGFYGATPITRPTVSGSRSGGAALTDLLQELENLGLIIDSSSA